MAESNSLGLKFETGFIMKILIVDDHPLVTSGLEAALKSQFKNCHVDVAHNLQQARSYIAEIMYDLAVVDINLPDGRGAQLFSDPGLAGKYPRHSILLSGTQDRDDIMSALQMGATAYITKSCDFKELMGALMRLQELDPQKGPYCYDCGKHDYVPARVVFPRGTALSAREHEIYELIRQGLTDKEIAFRLDRSVHTVRVQIRSIRRKRGENRRAAASQAA